MYGIVFSTVFTNGLAKFLFSRAAIHPLARYIYIRIQAIDKNTKPAVAIQLWVNTVGYDFCCLRLHKTINNSKSSRNQQRRNPEREHTHDTENMRMYSLILTEQHIIRALVFGK